MTAAAARRRQLLGGNDNRNKPKLHSFNMMPCHHIDYIVVYSVTTASPIPSRWCHAIILITYSTIHAFIAMPTMGIAMPSAPSFPPPLFLPDYNGGGAAAAMTAARCGGGNSWGEMTTETNPSCILSI